MSVSRFSTAAVLTVVFALLLGVGLVAFGDTFVSDEAVVTASTSSFPAALGSAISGRTVTVRALTIAAATSGTVTITDGSGGTTLGTFYVNASLSPPSYPVVVSDSILGRPARFSLGSRGLEFVAGDQGGMVTTAGNGLFFSGSGTGVVTITARIVRR